MKFAGLLPEVYERGLYRIKGFLSIHEFASKLAGMSGHAVDRVLWVAQKLRDKPALSAELTEGKTHWSKLERIATVATVETEQEWLSKVRTLPRPALEVAVHMAHESASVQVEPAWQTLSLRVSIETEKELRLKKSELERSFKRNLSWGEFLELLLKGSPSETQRLIHVEVCPSCVKAETQENPENHRHIPQKVQDLIQARYGGFCSFKGCRKPAAIQHHTRRFALNSSHDPDFILPLCKAHERFVHAGLIEDETQDPALWKSLVFPDRSHPKFRVDQQVQARWAPP